MYAPFWRAVAAVLRVARYAGAVAMAVLVVLGDSWLGIALRLDNPLRLLRGFAFVCALPWVLEWLIRRAFRARCTVTDEALVLERPQQRVEIPLAAIAAPELWRLPLPGSGLSLRLASGRRYGSGLQVGDPGALIEQLAAAAGAPAWRAAAGQPAARYARSRAILDRRRWWRPLLDYPVFALLLAVPIFRLHQWITFGGTFGEYYRFGLRAYALAFAIFWASYAVHLLLYAAVLRVLSETAVFGMAALITTDRLTTVRRVVEGLRAVLYYSAVPLLLLRLYLMSS